jgi:transmembrane 9 superfamily protein 3
MEPLVIIMAGGVLPFGSIFIEMYFIFTSFWAYKVYYVYGFMLLVFVILTVVTTCVTIVCTYFLLNAEVRSPSLAHYLDFDALDLPLKSYRLERFLDIPHHLYSWCVRHSLTFGVWNLQDYRWQWTSFLSGASTAIYVYLYSTYYFFFKTKMFGVFQTTFYFSYSALMALALGMMCGTLGYAGSAQFVHRIYRNVKID